MFLPDHAQEFPVQLPQQRYMVGGGTDPGTERQMLVYLLIAHSSKLSIRWCAAAQESIEGRYRSADGVYQTPPPPTSVSPTRSTSKADV